jgi:hypothetical protein
MIIHHPSGYIIPSIHKLLNINKMTKKKSLFLILLFLMSFASNASTYYVSSLLGDDSNSGLTASLPWKTLDQINSFSFTSGDSILFKSSEEWRGQLIPQSGNSDSNIYYGSYDIGSLPIFLGSLEFNNTSDWINIGGNIWKCETSFDTDVGNIIFNNSSSVGNKKWIFDDLQSQGDFWYDLSTNEVSLYSVSNPTATYFDIELALRKDVVHFQNTNFVTFENLEIKYGGAHGFGGGNTSHISIKSCKICYIGGGDLNMDGSIRYGNGVEFWGNASDNIVEKCKIFEIYDTGLTNQNHTNAVTQHNISYSNNIIWNCGLSSFEFWNRPSTSITSGIYFENNTCLFAGGGWGVQRPDYSGIHVLIDSNPSQTDSIHIKNNIFYNAQRSIYAVEDDINGFINLDYNLLHQPNISDTLLVLFPTFVVYDYGDFNTYTSSTNKDRNSITGDPLFTDLLGLDFTLSNTSICIDAGDVVNVTDDFDDNPRPYNDAFDIGAFEYTAPLSIVEQDKQPNWIVYPNPAKSYVKIVCSENIRKQVNLLLIDSNGKLVLSKKKYNIGESININHLKSGTYYLISEDTNFEIIMTKVFILR